ncbi:MAG: Flp1 family type IVb pilin [Anaerovoracaceae bacterium]
MKVNNKGINDWRKKMKIIKVLRNKSGMEMVQVAILVAIAIAVGLIFKTEITDFVNKIFSGLNSANF